MMVANQVDLIMNRVQQLSMREQLQVIKRVAELLGRADQPQGVEAQLTAMAADPEIQRELRQIEAEFAETETDGLPAEVKG